MIFDLGALFVFIITSASFASLMLL